ncbi:MAG TPA: hypothetical protein IAD17_01325 [Candidatus Coprovicinus avistercoris]|uniref:Uncharacterized protein n=1 Tax=Candidatus Coprovicinus avistercoris TaxID=2840754 RepID=A0A9D1HXP2_9ACTN|nr:hypothetical protein [Candidatus Coprovicinus avistercoris]
MSVEKAVSLFFSEPFVSIIISIASSFISYKCAIKESREEHRHEIDRLIKEQQLSIEREAQLYGFKKKYDATADVSNKLSNLASCASRLFPRGIEFLPKDEEKQMEYRDDLYRAASEALNSAQLSLKANTPFLSDDVFDLGMEIIRLCRAQLNYFQLLYGDIEKEKSVNSDAYERTEEISRQLDRALNLMKRDLEANTLLKEPDQGTAK